MVQAPDDGVTVRAALVSAAARRNEYPEARLDCQLLLAEVLGVSRSWLYAHDEAALTAFQLDAFHRLIERWADGVPVAQLLGRKAFFDLELAVSPATLVPRPETELLVETALSRLDPNAPLCIADPGTGTGAIAIALAHARPAWHVIASDVSTKTLEVAVKNSRSYGDAVTFVCGDWLTAFGDRSLDAIVSNPPYIREDDPHLDTLRHEPRIALVSGTDGLDAIRAILVDARRVLRPGGTLLIEHGYDQQPAVISAFKQAGLEAVDALSDFADNPRITVGTAP